MLRHGWLITALAVATLAAPRAVAAQAVAQAGTKPAATAVQPADAALEAFAKLQFTLNLARDEYNATLSKAHEPAAKDEAMTGYDKRRAEILASMGTTEAAYSRELYRVSSDPVRREIFDRLMKELAAK